MKRCPFCHKELSSGDIKAKHPYKCDLGDKNLSKDKIKYEYLLCNYPKIALFNKLEQEYVVNKKSLPELKSEFGISFDNITFLLKYFGIPARSIKESSRLPKTREKYKKTCLEKFGKDNALSRGTDAFEKRNKTVYQKYGVNNVFQIEFVKKKIDTTILECYGVRRVCNPQKISESRLKFDDKKWEEILEKYKTTSIKKYGVDWPSQTEDARKNKREAAEDYWENIPKDVKSNFVLSCKKRWNSLSEENKSKILLRLHNIKVSEPERRVNDILLKWGLEYTHSFYLKTKQFDFRIGRILLEVNGDFYHANPLKYKENDILPFPFGKLRTAKEVWEYDLHKKNMAEKLGYIVVYLWESEIKKCNENELESLIKKAIGII